MAELKLILDKKNLHHAYFLEGDQSEIRFQLEKFLTKEFGVKLRSNPDFWSRHFETLSIDDSRDLKERESRKAFSEGTLKIFIISFAFVTIEAQNALLKVFEEASSDTHFFIIAPSVSILIPTLRSRLHVFSIGKSKNLAILKMASSFLRSQPAERLQIIAPIIDRDNEEKKSELLAFFSAIEILLAKQKSTNGVKKENVLALEELLSLKRFLFSRAPSLKMIAEYVSLSLPEQRDI